VLNASEKQASATTTSSISATSSPLPELVSPNADKQVANVNREEDARRKAAEDAVREANEAAIRWQDLTEPIRSAKEDANKKKAVAVFYDPRMEEHLDWHRDDRKKKKERCPEVPERISRIFQRLEADNLIKQCIQPQCRKATWEDLQLIHEKSYVREIRRTRRGNEEAGKIAKQYSEQYGTLQMCSHSYDAALLSAGVVLDAVRRTCEGVFDQAICVVRPPGHHAEEKAGMGFCIFGNVALAVATARQKGWAERVLIVDWDVHHGNGTQKAFETDETVLFFSIHRYDLFPCTEYGNYTSDGTGSGKGFSLNVPWATTKETDSESMPGDTESF
jgi:histone deacetylase 6